jgi:hypothetical protein
MWTLRIVRGGEKAISVSDSKFATKRDLLNHVVGLGDIAYRRRVNSMYIVHVR